MELAAVLQALEAGRTKGRMVISYLRSSYILSRHNFYIAYYAEDSFVEEEPEGFYFSFGSVLGEAEKDGNGLGKNWMGILFGCLKGKGKKCGDGIWKGFMRGSEKY